jgi:hypothetical protein
VLEVLADGDARLNAGGCGRYGSDLVGSDVLGNACWYGSLRNRMNRRVLR